MRLLALAAVLAVSASAAEFTEVRAILEKSCFQCHNTQASLGGVALDTASGVAESADKIPDVITPGAKKPMPPMGALPKAERDVLLSWVYAGADWPEGVTLAEVETEVLERVGGAAVEMAAR